MVLLIPSEESRELCSKKVSDPLGAAQVVLRTHPTSVEDRAVTEVACEFVELSASLEPRWRAFSMYNNWVEKRREGEEPMFWDEEKNDTRSGKYALTPCSLVNRCLSRAVDMVNSVYTPDKLQSLWREIESSPETARQIANLRDIAIHAEGSMEQEAMNLVFLVAGHYEKTLGGMVRERAWSINPRPSRVDLLRCLVVDVPQSLQTQHGTTIYPGMVFRYFDNYVEIVKAELQLLATPAVLQDTSNTGAMVQFLNTNPVFRQSLTRQSNLDSEFDQMFVANFPELFGYPSLKKKTFTFVGAGFPLTGIILHIETGARVNLVDYDEEAVNNARKFLKLTDSIGITQPGYIRVILADAADVVYMPTTKLLPGLRRYDFSTCPVSEGSVKDKVVVPTDILDLASALPAHVTRQVFKENAAQVPVVRKRNVRGTSEVLYERFILDEEEKERSLRQHTFRLVGEVTPPQKVISGATPVQLVVGLTAPFNVNSCQLYINTCNFNSKLKFLEELIGTQCSDSTNTKCKNKLRQFYTKHRKRTEDMKCLDDMQ